MIPHMTGESTAMATLQVDYSRAPEKASQRRKNKSGSVKNGNNMKIGNLVNHLKNEIGDLRNQIETEIGVLKNHDETGGMSHLKTNLIDNGVNGSLNMNKVR